MNTRALAACALLLTLTACGDAAAEDAATATASLQEEILQNAATGVGEVTEDEAGCIARGAVDEIGVARLQEYGMLGDDLEVNKEIGTVTLEEADAASLAATFVACVDVESLFEKQFSQRSAGAAKLTAKQKRCINDAVNPAVIEDVLAASFRGDQDNKAYKKLTKSLLLCTVGKR